MSYGPTIDLMHLQDIQKILSTVWVEIFED